MMSVSPAIRTVRTIFARVPDSLLVFGSRLFVSFTAVVVIFHPSF